MQLSELTQHIGTPELLDTLAAYRKPHDAVERLVRERQLIRLCRGHYVLGVDRRRTPLDLGAIANALYGPSYVSFEYALSVYGLIPERVVEVTSATLVRSRSYDTPIASFSYQKMSRRRYVPGVVRRMVGGVPSLYASPEKALLDKVWCDLDVNGGELGGTIASYLWDDLRLDETLVRTLDADFISTYAPRFSPRVAAVSDYVSNWIRHA